jgi:hypothetical protein
MNLHANGGDCKEEISPEAGGWRLEGGDRRLERATGGHVASEGPLHCLSMIDYFSAPLGVSSIPQPGAAGLHETDFVVFVSSWWKGDKGAGQNC